MFILRLCRYASMLYVFLAAFLPAQQASRPELCLDGLCIGQSINDAHFDDVNWLIPKDGLTKETCNGIGCKPQVAFRGYTSEDQKLLAEALSWDYDVLKQYNLIFKDNIAALRRYKYECNPSPHGLGGERRFIGIYKSAPSAYITIVGLRLIGGELRVYRIARQFPYHNQTELVALAKKVRSQYGDEVLLYENLSSNAYSDVIQQRKKGWFGRSTMFNPRDLSDNAAELVLIDPNTRPLLEPTSMPESGEIQPLPVRMPDQCSAPVSID